MAEDVTSGPPVPCGCIYRICRCAVVGPHTDHVCYCGGSWTWMPAGHTTVLREPMAYRPSLSMEAWATKAIADLGAWLRDAESILEVAPPKRLPARVPGDTDMLDALRLSLALLPPPGRIDVGIQRDASLDGRNNVRLFAEDFTGVIFDLSIEPLAVRLPPGTSDA